MAQKFSPLLLLLTVMTLLTSCLGSDDDNTDNGYTFYDDAGLTSFSLGTLSWVRDTVTASGADSTYITTLSASDYDFYIDQANAQIYNVDSLPYGTRLDKVALSTGSKNSSYVYLKSLTSDSLTYCSSGDTIDVRQPRILRVVSLNGTTWRDYTVTVNVHKQKPNDLVWNSYETNGTLNGYTQMKALVKGDSVYVVGTDGQTTYLTATAINDPSHWTGLSTDINQAFSAEAYKSAVVSGDYIYLLTNGIVVRTADGKHYEQVAMNASLKQLVGATSTQLYALSTDGELLYSVDKGASWQADQTSGDTQYMPQTDINYVCQPVRTNSNMEQVLLVAKNAALSHAISWTKIVDFGENSVSYPWNYVSSGAEDRYPLPAYDCLSVVSYNNGVLAFGMQSDGTTSTCLFSQDFGITWKENIYLYLPTEFAPAGGVFAAATDSDNYIWLIEKGTGKVWRGRLNKLGWASNKRNVTE